MLEAKILGERAGEHLRRTQEAQEGSGSMANAEAAAGCGTCRGGAG